MRRVLLATVLVTVSRCLPGVPHCLTNTSSSGPAILPRRRAIFFAVIDANSGVAEVRIGGDLDPNGRCRHAPASHRRRNAGQRPRLLANGLHAGRTWLFDLTDPRQPKMLDSFSDVAGYGYSAHLPPPRQRQRCSRRSSTKADSSPMQMKMPAHGGMWLGGKHVTGGLA